MAVDAAVTGHLGLLFGLSDLKIDHARRHRVVIVVRDAASEALEKIKRAQEEKKGKQPVEPPAK